MTSSIRQFWQRLGSTVHPEDAPILASHPHTFNRDFPPPAFVGNVDNAPVVILMLNGGYDPVLTPSEFADAADITEHLEWLKGKRTDIPRHLSTYYTQQAVFPLVRKGDAVIVNAVAYRSPKITQEPQNQKVAKLLPSVRVHKQWLREEVLPAARDGTRLVIVHRWSLWDFSPKAATGLANVHHSSNPVSQYLADDMRYKIDSWLGGTRKGAA